MKVSGNPQAQTQDGGSRTDALRGKPERSFSDVLRSKKNRGEDPLQGPSTSGNPTAESGTLPLSPAPGDPPPVEAGQAIARPEAILSSLAREITVEAPPGGNSTVDIQFDSRTLDGLHVRIQKTGDSVNVHFSTSSPATSQLLSGNTDGLAQALVQRGYVAPTISVQPASSSVAYPAGTARRGDREGGSRGRQDQGSGQKRR